MATTTWIPLHVGKDGSILKALQRTITYVENPNKTENGTLVTGYECTPDIFFHQLYACIPGLNVDTCGSIGSRM